MVSSSRVLVRKSLPKIDCDLRKLDLNFLYTEEYILQHASRVPEEQALTQQAPEPLLPNYGVGRIRQYNLDLDMMTMLNSQERPLTEFIKLGEAAGLEFVKLWDFGETGLVEYKLPVAQRSSL